MNRKMIRYAMRGASGFMIFFVFMLASARATLIIVLHDNDKGVTIAADSQVSLTDGKAAGTTCKIHVTQNNGVWVAAGILQEAHGPFNPWLQAKAAVEDGGAPDDTAAKFETAVTDPLKDYLVRAKERGLVNYAQITKNKVVLAIIFFKGIALAGRDFYVPDPSDPTTLKIVRHACPCAGSLRVLMGEHDAVDKELVKNPRLFVERDSLAALNFLFEQQHAARPNTVGGPTSIVHIDPDGRVQWLQRGTCQ
jgi:hypothetical protein